MTLTRDQIMAHAGKPLRTEVVEVPEWGGSVTVRELTGRERDAFEASIVEQKGKKSVVNMDNMRAKFVSACVIGDDGQSLFYPTDVERLGDLSAAALNRVFDVGRRLSGLTDDDMEELEKN